MRPTGRSELRRGLSGRQTAPGQGGAQQEEEVEQGMIHETTTSLAPEEVLQRAKDFFAERVPATGCFLERESPRHVVLRGQGGEEVVIAVFPAEAGGVGGTAVRGSTLLFDQQVGRFLATLPAGAAEAA